VKIRRDISKTVETLELKGEEPTGILEREGMSERKQRLPPCGTVGGIKLD
jgi:hypothetical protein